MSEEAIPQHVLRAAGRALKFQILSEINMVLARSGLPVETVAQRLGWSRRRLVQRLRGRGAVTLKEIASIVFAIDGSMLDFSLTPSTPASSKDSPPTTGEAQPVESSR